MRNKRRAAQSVSHPLGGRTTYVVGLGALSGVRAGFRCGHHLMQQRVVLSAARAEGVNLLFHALASAQQPAPAHQADVVCSELADHEHAHNLRAAKTASSALSSNSPTMRGCRPCVSNQ